MNINQLDRSLKPIPNKLIATSPPKLTQKKYSFSPKSPYNRQDIPKLIKYSPIKRQKNKPSTIIKKIQNQQNQSRRVYQNSNENQYLLLNRSMAQSQYVQKSQSDNEIEQKIIEENKIFQFRGYETIKKEAVTIQRIQEQILNKYKKYSMKDIRQDQQNQIVQIQPSKDTISRFPNQDKNIPGKKGQKQQKIQQNLYKNRFKSILQADIKDNDPLNLKISKERKKTQQQEQRQRKQQQEVQQVNQLQNDLQDSRTNNQQIQQINDQILNAIYSINFKNSKSNNRYSFLTQQHTPNSIDLSSINNQNNSQKVSMNPLNLLHYSLHNHIKPTFIEDETHVQNQINLEQFNSIDSKNKNNHIIQPNIQWISNLDLNKYQSKQQNDNRNSNEVSPNKKRILRNDKQQKNSLQFSQDYISLQKKQDNKSQNQKKKIIQQKIQKQIQNQAIKQLQTMSIQLFSYYLGNRHKVIYQFPQNSHFKKNQVTDNLQESYLIQQDHNQSNSLHMNSFISTNHLLKKDINYRARPLNNYNIQNSSPYKILDKSYQSARSGDQFTNRPYQSLREDYFSDQRYQQQNFIEDKRPQQVISSIITNRQKLKLYLKYIQCQIAKSDQKQDIEIRQVYQILSCLLIKLNTINQNSTEQRNSLLAYNIIRMFDKRQKQKPKVQVSLIPTISLSQKGIKIQFDSYMNHKKKIMNQRICYLKSLLQQKKCEEELIKLSYDEVIHDYAQSLSNVAKSKQLDSRKLQRQDEIAQHLSEPQQNFIVHNMTSSKIYEMQENRSSLSLNHKMYRKATFGKAPSSMRNSNQNEQI